MKLVEVNRWRHGLLVLALVIGAGGCWPSPMSPGGEDDSEEREDGEGGPDGFQSSSLYFAEIPQSP